MIDDIRRNIEGRLANLENEAATLQNALDALDGKLKPKRTASAATRRKMSESAKQRWAKAAA